jgi:hypothetical protein
MKKYLVFSLLLAIIFSRILFIQPTNQIVGDGGDNYEVYGYMYVAHDNLAHGKYPFAHSILMRYPGGFDYSYGYDGAFSILTGALLNFVITLPLAYNLTIVAILWFNLFLSFYFFRKIAHLVKIDSHSQDLQYLIAGLIFSWSPFVFARLNGHLNLAFVGGFPVLLYFLIKFFWLIWHEQKISFVNLLGIGVGILAVSMGSLQYLILTVECGIVFLLFTLIILGKSVIIWLGRFIRSLTPRSILSIITSLCFTTAGFLFLYYGYLWAMLTHNFSTEGIDYAESVYFPKLIDLFVPNSYLGSWWAYISSSPAQIEKVSAFGLISLALFIIFILRNKNKKLLAVIISLFGFFVIAGLSLIHLPFIPEPGRVAVIVLLVMSVLWIVYEAGINKKILICILVLLIVEHVFYLIQVSPLMPWKAAQIVSETPGAAVLNVPLSGIGFTGALPSLWQKSILDGSFHHTANNMSSKSMLQDSVIANFICDKNHDNNFSQSDIAKLYAKLKQLNISTVVLFKQGVGQEWWYPECANVREWWNFLNPVKAIPSTDNTNPTLQRFEFGQNSAISAPMVFDYSGSFEVDSISLWPPQVDDFTIQTSDGSKIIPNWHMAKNNKDLEAEYSPSFSIPVATNSAIRLFSNKTVGSNTYVGLSYRYIPAQMDNFLIPKKPSLKLIWEDDSMEAYVVINN